MIEAIDTYVRVHNRDLVPGLSVRFEELCAISPGCKLGAGLYYYAAEPATAARVVAAASEVDSGDVELAWTLYRQPELGVFGPNDAQRNSG